MEAIKDRSNKMWNRTNEIWTNCDSVTLLEDLSRTIIAGCLWCQISVPPIKQNSQFLLVSIFGFTMSCHIQVYNSVVIMKDLGNAFPPAVWRFLQSLLHIPLQECFPGLPLIVIGIDLDFSLGCQIQPDFQFNRPCIFEQCLPSFVLVLTDAVKQLLSSQLRNSRRKNILSFPFSFYLAWILFQ